MRTKTGYFTALFAALVCAAGAAAEEAVFRADMNPRDEAAGRIYLGDVPFMRGNRFTLHSPGWSTRYVRNIVHPGHVKEEFRKTDTSVFRRVTETRDGVATLDEYSVRCSGTSAVITVEAAMRKKLPAQVENTIGLAPWVLENADYEVVTPDGKTLRGHIPESENARRPEETLLIPEFRKGTFRNHFGTTSVEVLEGPAMHLNDRRIVRPLAWGKSFLLWTSDVAIARSDSKFRQTVKLSYERPQGSLLPKTSLAVPADRLETIDCPAEKAPDFPLLPRPRDCRFTRTDYRVQSGDKLTISGNAPERLLRHAKKFAAQWGLEPVSGASDANARGIRIVCGSSPADESYSIRVFPDGIDVRAKGERGAFYALQTLRALKRDGRFRGAVIEDFPAFEKRVIHANADSDAKAFLGEMIEKVLAPLKINTIILECPYVEWEATKGKHRRKGMPKKDLAEFLRIAEENYITVYPLVPTLSHSEWFFWNGKDTDLRENPKDPRSYNSLDPRVYEKLAALFDEVLEAFHHPEYFHISHDELYEQPTTPAGKKLGLVRIFYDDVMWHYAFFKKRGVKLMMWHDMLIARNEVKIHAGVTANARAGTEALRRKLPRDITICMWDYAAVKGGQFTQIDLLRQDGFTVWGAGWFYPDNLEQLTAYAYRKKLPGMIETTWHNKVGSGSLLQTQYPQLKAYIRAAALFWNPRERVKTDPARIYADLMRPEPRPERRVRPLSVRCNTLLTDKRDGFDKLPETLRMNDGMTFKLAKRDGQTGAVMTRSVETPDFPAKVRIPVKAECRKLHLLQTTLSKAVRADNIAVKLVIRYKDGGVEAVWPRNSIDINYGSPPVFRENGRIAERVTEVGTPCAPYTFFMNHRNVFEWKNADGETRRIWYLTWENPHPDREIDHLLVEAVPNGSSYALLALDMEQ